MDRFTSAACATIVAGGLTLVPSGLAEVSRGCSAQWEARWSSTIVSEKLQDPTIIAFGRFNSRGRCSSTARADDCRQEARGYALSCFEAHWSDRWTAEKPLDCMRHRGGRGVQNYAISDLKGELERQVCGRLHPTGTIQVQLVGRTWGGSLCVSEMVLSRSYAISGESCASLVATQ
jgi:hypothetical protein